MRYLSPVTPEAIEDLMHLFAQAWWTQDRTPDDVVKVLHTSDFTAGFSDSSGRLVAFVRILTDWHFKAIVMDLIVDAEYRRAGLGRALCDNLLADDRLASVADVELYCHSDLVDYYGSMGFTEPPETHFMRRSRMKS